MRIIRDKVGGVEFAIRELETFIYSGFPAMSCSATERIDQAKNSSVSE